MVALLYGCIEGIHVDVYDFTFHCQLSFFRQGKDKYSALLRNKGMTEVKYNGGDEKKMKG